MADLTSTPALTGLPLTIGTVTLSALDPGRVTAVAPYPGRDLSTHLPMPSPGDVIDHAGGRIVWAGRETAFVLGVEVPDLAGLAAVTDQTDGWAWVTLSGPDALEVLARLTPLDLRSAAFPVGRSARTLLSHIGVLMVRVAPDAVQIAAFRSMAQTLVHEIGAAMRAVAARRAL